MSDKFSTTPPKGRMRRGATPLGALVPKMVGPIFSKRGFAGADMAVHWPEIAGAGVARYSRPLAMQWPRGGAENGMGATLVVGATSAFALDLQQMAPVILERINRRLGWRAVARLTIRQMPIKPPEAPKQRMQPSAEAKAQASRIAAGIGDERLRSALERLGAAAITRQGRMARPKDGGLS